MPLFRSGPLAVALGASLYLGILGLSVLPFVPGLFELPGNLGLVADPATTVAAVGLYLVAWAVRGHPSLELFWGVGNVGIRFVAVGLLGLFLFPEGLSSLSVLLLVGAAGTAAFVQFQRVGWMVLDHRGSWIPARRWIQRLGVEAIALGILWLAVLDPSVGVVASAIGLGLFAVWGRACYQAGWLAIAIVIGSYRSAFGRSGWLSGAALPGWVRRAMRRRAEVGADSARATRAALVCSDRGGTLLYGWLVSFVLGPVFLSRSFGRPREVPLDTASAEGWTRSSHLTELSIRDSKGALSLLLPPGGPEPEELEGLFSTPALQNI
ncbi:MAG: hypothetical protein EXR92_04660 [Gemmatimonadetes bacterium]|nr:hypothetical protein [Gemmatimonadota bacterium]